MDGHGEGEHLHPHDAPERRGLIPEFPLLWRGAAFAAVAVGALWAAVAVIQKGGWLLAPAGGLLSAAGALSAWAALIHLTGGEKFDDHPMV